MNYYVSELLSYSIVPAVITGIVYYSRITNRYRLFIWYLWVCLLNEIAGTILIHTIRNNAYSNNLFILAEWLLLGSFYYVLSLAKLQKRIYIIIGIVLVVLWVWEHFFYNSLGRFTHIFRIVYSIVLVFMSINQLKSPSELLRLLDLKRKRSMKLFWWADRPACRRSKML